MAALGGQNLLDKAIAYVAPQLATRRLIARTQLAISGSYTGARIDRAQLARWLPTASSANSDTLADLPMLRARSRDQMRNAPVAVGALNQTVSNVVGTGLSHSAAIDHEYLGLTEEEADAWQTDADRRFSAWCDSVDCHLERQLNFYGLQEIAFRSELESGDLFVITPRVQREQRSTRLALQLIEADRVCNPQRGGNTATLMEGIELSESTGEAIAAYVARKHPGDAGPTVWDRVVFRGASTGRRNVLHCFTPLRPGQVRGVPWIAPILEPLKQLTRWSEAELNAAVTSSIFSVFIKMDPEAFQDIFDETAQGTIVDQASQWSGAMDSGKAINLLPGEDVVTTTPGRPNPQFDPFWTAIVRQIGMAIEMPYEVLIMHFQSSYTAARGALLMAWRVWRRRRDRLVTNLCQPVYELWLADEVAEGRIGAPGFFANPTLRAAWCAGVWTGDGPGSIDPQKEVGAAADRVALEISTLEAESILHDGVAWKTKHRQRVKELRAQREDGTLTPQPGAAAAAAPLPAPNADDLDD
jgi:lambda family phage portal protein